MTPTNSFTLEEISFVAGSFYTIEFTVYDGDISNLADLTDYTVSCVISAWGQPNTVALNKVGTKTGAGKFKVDLLTADTINLSGKYIYQPLLALVGGTQYRPAQGILTIAPAIN